MSALNHLLRKASGILHRGAKASYQAIRPEKELADTLLLCGMPHSGADILGQVLAKSWDTQVFRETNKVAFENYHIKSLANIRGLRYCSRAKVFVLENLCDIHLLPQLGSHLRPAKIIWIYRSFQEVVYELEHRYQTPYKELVGSLVCPGTGESPPVDQPKNHLIRLINPRLNNTSLFAVKWFFRNQLFFDLGLDKLESVLLVNYQHLCSGTEPELYRITKFCGISGAKMKEPRKTKSPRIDPLILDPEVRGLCFSLQSRLDILCQYTALKGRST